MRLLAVLAFVILTAPLSPALAQKPSAERPTYEVGDAWELGRNLYTLVRIERDTYIFTGPGGRELHLNRDLVVTKSIVGGRIVWELTTANEWPWPLEVGKIRRGKHIGPRGTADVITSVDAFEDVQVAGGRFKAFKVTAQVFSEQGRPIRVLTTWYAPDVRRIVKSENTGGPSMNFEVTAIVDRSKAVASSGLTERPTYASGDRWIVNGVVYEVTRADRDGYTFTGTGGHEIRLTRDLSVSKVVRAGRTVYDLETAPKWPWPLSGGKFTQTRAFVTSPPAGVPGRGNSPTASGDFQVTTTVESYEDVVVPAGRFKAFKITEEWGRMTAGAHTLWWRNTLWYAPELRRIVKSESTATAMVFEVTGLDDRTPAVAANPPPAPPAVASAPPAPPVSRAPPAITVIDPKVGELVRTPEATLKIEVRSEHRLKALVVKGRGPEKTFAPEPGAKAGEPWIVDAKLPLAEGANTVRLEAIDEHGARAAETMRLTRESLVAIDLDGPPQATVRVDQDTHALDPSGKVTLHLAPGRYQLEATKDGFITLRHTLQVSAGQTKVTQKLAMIQAVPPVLAVLSPAPGAVVASSDARLKVEVRSRYKLGALRVGREHESVHQTFVPPASAKTGETWVVEPVIALVEGDNTLRLDVVDEHGTRAEQRLILTRRTAVAAVPPTDGEAPKIAINYPAADTNVEAESIVILGLVTDNGTVDRVQVTVNGVEVAQPRDLAVVGRGVPLRVPAARRAGPNVIEVNAADKTGNVAQVVRTVTRGGAAVATPGPPAPKVSNRWAVVVGIGEYDNRTIPKLRFATRDAEAMYQFLTTQGGYPKENVVLLTDATPQKPTLLNIKRALGDFLARRAGREDMVLIYFAGHGAPEVDTGGVEADGLSKYLIPRDGDPESLYTTALPMDEIQRIFGRVAAERIVMLLDTCYSGNAGGRTFARASTRAAGLNDQFLDRLTRSRGRVIITASGPNEVALELPNLGHGVFTYYVLEGLKGKADRNNDGLVTVSELYEFVEDQVDSTARRAGGRQRPLMKGEIEGTLPLAKTR